MNHEHITDGGYLQPFALRDVSCMSSEERKELLKAALYVVWSNTPRPTEGEERILGVQNAASVVKSYLNDKIATYRLWQEACQLALDNLDCGSFHNLLEKVEDE